MAVNGCFEHPFTAFFVFGDDTGDPDEVPWKARD
jgi:hypothetical protein